jgi:plastocyanin
MWARSGGPGRKAIAFPLGVALLALMPASASAVADVITNSGNTFTQATYNSQVGDLVQFQHSGTGAPHDVTSSQSLFSSATISTGTTPVNGTQFLPPGTYPFYCSVHPTQMRASLIVSATPGGSSTPAARPDIELNIISRKLDKVVAKGKLVLEVLAITKSDDVSVAARQGKRTLGERTDLDLAAGQSSRVDLRLRRAVRRKLAALDKAKVTAEAMVPFGEPDTAKRVLK